MLILHAQISMVEDVRLLQTHDSDRMPKNHIWLVETGKLLTNFYFFSSEQVFFIRMLSCGLLLEVS